MGDLKKIYLSLIINLLLINLQIYAKTPFIVTRFLNYSINVKDGLIRHKTFNQQTFLNFGMEENESVPTFWD